MTGMLLPPWLIIALTVLTVARLTRLLVEDGILDRPRAWAQNTRSDLLAYLVTCPWCMSTWVAAATAPTVYAWHDRWFVQVPLIGLAASHATGLLAQHASRVDAETAAAAKDATR